MADKPAVTKKLGMIENIPKKSDWCTQMYTNLCFQWSLGTEMLGRLAFFTDFVKTNLQKNMLQQSLKTTAKNMKLMVKWKF